MYEIMGIDFFFLFEVDFLFILGLRSLDKIDFGYGIFYYFLVHCVALHFCMNGLSFCMFLSFFYSFDFFSLPFDLSNFIQSGLICAQLLH